MKGSKKTINLSKLTDKERQLARQQLINGFSWLGNVGRVFNLFNVDGKIGQ